MYPRRHPGVTLIEVLIVISLMTIIAAAVLPNSNPSIHEQLDAVAELLASDLAYARSLAVANNSTYRIAFDVQDNEYVLEHTGGNSALDELPHSALRQPDDDATQQVVRLSEIPHLAIDVSLHAVQTVATSIETVTEVEFNGIGGTAQAEDTAVWLSCGRGSEKRYLCVRVSAATGQAWIENYQATAPQGAASQVNHAPLNGGL